MQGRVDATSDLSTNQLFHKKSNIHRPSESRQYARAAFRGTALKSALACFSNCQKKSSAVLTASKRRCFIVRASGDKYQTIAKPPIAPIAPTASNVTVPHWGNGDPVALDALDVSAAGALLALVAEKALSKPRNLFLASAKTKVVRRKNAFCFLAPRGGGAERSMMVSDFLRLDAISNSFRFEKNRTTK
jgi:hypothetical protein